MDKAGLFAGIIRSFLASIDAIFYSLSGAFLNLILNISKLSINMDVVQPFINRVYFVLTVYMLFRSAIILLNTIANPSLLTDSKLGMGKFVQRIILVFVLLAFTPTIFKLMSDLQGPIIETLPKIILGLSEDELNAGSVNEDGENERGTLMALSMMNGYFSYNPYCKGDDKYGSKEKVDEKINNYLDYNYASFNDLSNNQITITCKGDQGKYYAYKYAFFISTISAGIMLFVLISFSIDIAIRLIKLAVLQIISPIPIITYMDPKSEKSGPFQNWVKEVTSTYLELFLKLGTMYFMIYLISELFVSGENIFSATAIGGMTKTFIGLGILIFARAIPDYIKTIFGIKSSSLGLKAMGAGLGAIVGGAGIMGALGETGAALGEGSQALATGKGFDGIGGLNKGLASKKNLLDGKVEDPNFFQRTALAAQGRKAGHSATTMANATKAKDDAKKSMDESNARLAAKREQMNKAYNDIAKLNEKNSTAEERAAAQASYDIAKSDHDQEQVMYQAAQAEYQIQNATFEKEKEAYKKYGGDKNQTLGERYAQASYATKELGRKIKENPEFTVALASSALVAPMLTVTGVLGVTGVKSFVHERNKREVHKGKIGTVFENGEKLRNARLDKKRIM